MVASKILSAIAMLTSLSVSVLCSAQQATGEITIKHVSRFLSMNRSNLLVEYACLQTDSSACKIKCSSGGEIFLDISSVDKAYYAERLNRIDSSLAGFYVIVDVNRTSKQSDSWVTLQLASSCQFAGLTPKLK